MSLGRFLDATRRLRVQFALILAIAMAPAGLVAVLQATSNLENAIRLEENELRKHARQISEDERSAILAIRERLLIAARAPGIRALSGKQCDDAVSRLAANDPRFAGALVLDPEGVSVCGETKDLDVSDTVAFQSFKAAPQLLVGPVRSGRLDGRNMLLALSPVVGNDGKSGILAVGLAADFFQAMAAGNDAPPVGEGRKVHYALLDQAGTVFADNRSSGRDWLPTAIDSLLSEEESVVHLTARDGSNNIYFVAPMPIERMWMIASVPQLTWSDMLLSEEALALIAPLLLWAIAVGVAFFVIDRMVSRPIVYLQRVAAAIGRGHLDIGPIKFDGAPYEIQRLGTAVETMAERLAEREATLRGNVEAKKALLMEIHHRVKNNLQMISSLMNMQLRRVDGAAEQEAIRTLQDRIHGLALVHQNLYSAERLDAVMLDALVRDISEHLRQSLSLSGEASEVRYELDPIEATADVATPVALFLTEAVSNVFKHQRQGKAPSFDVHLLRTGDDQFDLEVSNLSLRDAPRVQEPHAKGGLGGQLMEGFARQIGGRITRDFEGQTFTVRLSAPLSTRSRGFAIRARNRVERLSARSENEDQQRESSSA